MHIGIYSTATGRFSPNLHLWFIVVISALISCHNPPGHTSIAAEADVRDDPLLFIEIISAVPSDPPQLPHSLSTRQSVDTLLGVACGYQQSRSCKLYISVTKLVPVLCNCITARAFLHAPSMAVPICITYLRLRGS